MGDRDTPYDDYSAYVEKTGRYAVTDYDELEDRAYEKYRSDQLMEEEPLV